MPEPQPTQNPAPGDGPLRSVHTANFGEILKALEASLFVTTYQAGKLVILRANEQGVINTHFCGYERPMGLAIDGNRLAIGTHREIREYHNAPAVARQSVPAGQYDAAFLPRTARTTGDIQIHEMAWMGQELWFINTRFSCLCTRSDLYSFVPRWRPDFITELAPEDRCHLNGLGMFEGRIRYVTALGQSNKPGGWRENKKSGGVLMDLDSNQIIVRGLSMPHSPRCYDGKLWVLNSGCGGLGTIDPASGAYQEVARVPGFTRGLDFAGPLAFVGLSQVRESAHFSGIEIAELPLEQRCAGVWVINIHTGKIIATLKFEQAVQEIFAVQVAQGIRYPDVVNDVVRINNAFVLPDAALADVAAPLRFPANAAATARAPQPQ